MSAEHSSTKSSVSRSLPSHSVTVGHHAHSYLTHSPHCPLLASFLPSASRSYHSQQYGLRFDVVALCDSTGYVHSANTPLSDSTLTSLLAWKQSKKPFSSFQPGGSPHESPASIVASIADGHTLTVDCSASDNTIDALLAAVEKGGGVTMANKKPLCCPLPSFTRLLSPAVRSRCRYESTVGAGTPFIATLHRLLQANDCPHFIQGTLSGTLAYLCSGLQQGRKYSEVVQEAYKLGYTEPEPRDDLGGVDVGRKALILARSMGWPLELSDVSIEPLYPPSLASLPVPDFLAALPQLDAQYAERNEAAKRDGRVLRYVATITEQRCKVGLEALPLDSPLGRLAGTDNLLVYRTPIYGDKGLVVQGGGAGGDVTAAGVLSDMVELAWTIGKQLEVDPLTMQAA